MTNPQAGSAMQTGMDRYINISKRKLTPSKNADGNKPKVNRTSKGPKNLGPLNENRFSILAEHETESEQLAPRKLKPPPIFIREKTSNALVNNIVELVGKDSFHVIPFMKGNIN
ncbi:uncharacterized protein [Drosophila takahashii]|uniref:uncharacterized protein n=1 Tax=Drosophila takahashii TaxID=29030 RepID=UPI001CF8AD45|nr:uncharacterized protein LOC123002917 [Drosophila takahashii]